jgi:hypothetical protein
LVPNPQLVLAAVPAAPLLMLALMQVVLTLEFRANHFY